MFEIPIALTSRKRRTARKLRYQYVNSLVSKYNRIERTINHGLPTPENSATEASENEEALQKKRRRIRRGLKSVAGDSYSDTETDEDETEGENHGKEEREGEEQKFFERYEKPQESFEKWQNDVSKRTPIRRNKISFTKYQRLRKHAKRKIANFIELGSKSDRIYIDTISEGFEMLDPLDERYQSFQMKHTTTLITLLHLNLSQKNWNMAYACFALLVRLPHVDVRNVWGMGERILQERDPMKSLEFLEWMSSVYSSRVTFSEEVNFRTPPVFTKGSKTHVAKFTSSWMWESLIQCTKDSSETRGSETLNEHDALQELIERLSEMVIVPPYMDFSEVWFIFALCHMIKADRLSSRFDPRLTGSTRDIASNQVFQHIQSTKVCLQTCSKKGDFYYPKRYIERQLEEFERRLSREPGLEVDENNDENNDGNNGKDIMHYNLDTQSLASEDDVYDDGISEVTSSD